MCKHPCRINAARPSVLMGSPHFSPKVTALQVGVDQSASARITFFFIKFPLNHLYILGFGICLPPAQPDAKRTDAAADGPF